MNSFLSKDRGKIDFGSKQALSVQIREILKARILSEDIKANDKIPPETDLADIFGVSRMTAREAVMDLVQQGLLYRHVGRGTFVSPSSRKRNEILWVCGMNITEGDISPYFTHLLRVCSSECEKLGLKIVPIWLSGDSSFDSFVADIDRRYSGYIFIGCSVSHPLIRLINSLGSPYVHITNEPLHFRSVANDFVQGIRLGFRYFLDSGERNISIICHKCYQENFENELRTYRSIKAEIVSIPERPHMSQVIKDGYEAVSNLLTKKSLANGVFIFDDVLALGVSAALLEYDLEKAKQVNMLVKGAGHVIIPFCNSVMYLANDTDEEGRQAVAILYHQICANASPPYYYEGKFHLRRFSSKEESLIIQEEVGRENYDK